MQHENSDAAKEFLLEDYKYLQESFWKNETVGETRANFFISLVTAVLAGMIALVTTEGYGAGETREIPEFTLRIMTCVLTGLLLLGIVTLLRMVVRNAATNGYKKDMDKIRQRFKDYFDPNGILEGYHPFKGNVLPRGLKQNEKISIWKELGIRSPGGLTYMIAAMNSILFAGIVASCAPNSEAAIYLMAGLIFLIIQIGAICFLELWSGKKLKANNLTHAGGVVYRLENDAPHFLLINATEDENEFVFPKGHFEKGESDDQVAIREVLEETGRLCRIIRPIGTNGFVHQKIEAGRKVEKMVLCKYYLMECITPDTPGTEPDPEARRPKWCSYHQARKLVRHEDMRQLLDSAMYFLSRRS